MFASAFDPSSVGGVGGVLGNANLAAYGLGNMMSGGNSGPGPSLLSSAASDGLFNSSHVNVDLSQTGLNHPYALTLPPGLNNTAQMLPNLLPGSANSHSHTGHNHAHGHSHSHVNLSHSAVPQPTTLLQNSSHSHSHGHNHSHSHPHTHSQHSGHTVNSTFGMGMPMNLPLNLSMNGNGFASYSGNLLGNLNLGNPSPTVGTPTVNTMPNPTTLLSSSSLSGSSASATVPLLNHQQLSMPSASNSTNANASAFHSTLASSLTNAPPMHISASSINPATSNTLTSNLYFPNSPSNANNNGKIHSHSASVTSPPASSGRSNVANSIVTAAGVSGGGFGGSSGSAKLSTNQAASTPSVTTSNSSGALSSLSGSVGNVGASTGGGGLEKVSSEVQTIHQLLYSLPQPVYVRASFDYMGLRALIHHCREVESGKESGVLTQLSSNSDGSVNVIGGGGSDGNDVGLRLQRERFAHSTFRQEVHMQLDRFNYFIGERDKELTLRLKTLDEQLLALLQQPNASLLRPLIHSAFLSESENAIGDASMKAFVSLLKSTLDEVDELRKFVLLNYLLLMKVIRSYERHTNKNNSAPFFNPGDEKSMGSLSFVGISRLSMTLSRAASTLSALKIPLQLSTCSSCQTATPLALYLQACSHRFCLGCVLQAGANSPYFRNFVPSPAVLDVGFPCILHSCTVNMPSEHAVLAPSLLLYFLSGNSQTNNEQVPGAGALAVLGVNDANSRKGTGNVSGLVGGDDLIRVKQEDRRSDDPAAKETPLTSLYPRAMMKFDGAVPGSVNGYFPAPPGAASAQNNSTFPYPVPRLRGVSCHQCKSSRPREFMLFCVSIRRRDKNHLKKTKEEREREREEEKKNDVEGKRRRKCRKKYCAACLLRSYGISIEQFTDDEKRRWICPSCLGVCSCAACTRREIKRQLKGKSPSANANSSQEHCQAGAHTNLTLNSVVNSHNHSALGQVGKGGAAEDCDDDHDNESHSKRSAKKSDRNSGGSARQSGVGSSNSLSDNDDEDEDDEDDDALYGSVSENEGTSDMRVTNSSDLVKSDAAATDEPRLNVSSSGINLNVNLSAEGGDDGQKISSRTGTGLGTIGEDSDGSDQHDNGDGPRKRANVLSMQQMHRVDHSPIYFSPSSHSASPISPSAPAPPLHSTSPSPSPPNFSHALTVSLALNSHHPHDSPKQSGASTLEVQQPHIHAQTLSHSPPVLQGRTSASSASASVTANQDLGVSPATMFRSLSIVPITGGSQNNSNTNSPIKPPLSLPNVIGPNSSSSSRNSSPTPGSPSQAYSRMKRPYSSDNSISAPSTTTARKASSSRAIPSSSSGLLSSTSPAISEVTVQSVPLMPRSMDISAMSGSNITMVASAPSGVRMIASEMSDMVEGSGQEGKPMNLSYTATESLLRLTNDEHRPNKREKAGDDLECELSNSTMPAQKVLDPFAQSFSNYSFSNALGNTNVTPKLDAGNALTAAKSDSLPTLFDSAAGVGVPLSMPISMQMHTLTNPSTSLDRTTHMQNPPVTNSLAANSMAVESTAIANQN